jgi:chromosome partitioning protein
VVQEVKRVFGKQVFNTVIPRSIRLAEAPSYGMPISVFAPDSTGARSYATLAKELLISDDVQIPIVQEAN